MGHANHKSLPGAAGDFLLAAIRKFINGEEYLAGTNDTLASPNATGTKRFYSIAELYGERIEYDSMGLNCSPFVLVGLEAEYDRKYGRNNAYGHDKLKYVKERLPQLTDTDIDYFRMNFRKTAETEAARLGITAEPTSTEQPPKIQSP